MTNDVTANKKHKDRFFRFLFKGKPALLALYNAINGTAYENPEELTINTLEDVLIMGMKNDVSFMVGDTINLYEHQSTYNPNMPLRGLFYLADLLRGYIASEQLDLYSSSQIPLPFPRYVVFYNGEKDRPDREVLKLSDSYYPQNEVPALELTCVLLNINEGHNRELMEKCPLLAGYAHLISCIRSFTSKGYQLAAAIRKAIDVCIRENVLADFLRKHKEEVFHMLLTETDWTLHEKSEQKIWHEKGLSQGLSQGDSRTLVKIIDSIVRKRHLTLEKACEEADYTVEDYQNAKEFLAKLENKI